MYTSTHSRTVFLILRYLIASFTNTYSLVWFHLISSHALKSCFVYYKSETPIFLYMSHYICENSEKEYSSVVIFIDNFEPENFLLFSKDSHLHIMQIIDTTIAKDTNCRILQAIQNLKHQILTRRDSVCRWSCRNYVSYFSSECVSVCSCALQCFAAGHVSKLQDLYVIEFVRTYLSFASSGYITVFCNVFWCVTAGHVLEVAEHTRPLFCLHVLQFVVVCCCCSMLQCVVL